MTTLEMAEKIHYHTNSNQLPEALSIINTNMDKVSEILQQKDLTLADLKRLSMEEIPDELFAKELLRRYTGVILETDNEQEDLVETIDYLSVGDIKPETWKKLLALIEN